MQVALADAATATRIALMCRGGQSNKASEVHVRKTKRVGEEGVQLPVSTV